MSIYLISDTHFNHTNIIEYCDRPFESAVEMDNYIIEKWNSVVGEEDIVYHLGDFAFNMSKEEVTELISKLNGTIILIMGNHDRKGKEWFKECGIEEVHKKHIIIGTYILTHKPLDKGMIPEGLANVHGHIHNHHKNEYIRPYHINVSCEVIDYTPVLIEDL